MGLIAASDIGAADDVAGFINRVRAAVRSAQRAEVMHPIVFEEKGVRFAAIGRRIADDLTGIVETSGSAFCPAQRAESRELTAAIEEGMALEWVVVTGGGDECIPSHHLGEVVDRQSHTLWTGIGRDIDELAMTIGVRIAPDIADDLAGSINIQCAAPNPSAIIKI